MDGEASYLAEYNGVIVSESWISIVSWAIDIFARSWDNFNALSSQRLFDKADLPRSGLTAKDLGDKRNRSSGLTPGSFLFYSPDMAVRRINTQSRNPRACLAARGSFV